MVRLLSKAAISASIKYVRDLTTRIKRHMAHVHSTSVGASSARTIAAATNIFMCRISFKKPKYVCIYIYIHMYYILYGSSKPLVVDKFVFHMVDNKANLRDLIAATGLVILLKFDPNHRFFVPCDLKIWWMTLENNRAPLLYYMKLCASFQIHRWIETEVTVRKRSIRVKIGDFLSCVTLKFDGWPWKTIGHLFYATPSFVHHFKSIGEFKLELQSGNAQFGSKSAIFCPVWPWNLTDDLEKQ